MYARILSSSRRPSVTLWVCPLAALSFPLARFSSRVEWEKLLRVFPCNDPIFFSVEQTPSYLSTRFLMTRNFVLLALVSLNATTFVRNRTMAC